MAQPSSSTANSASKSSFGLVIDGADINTTEEFQVFDPITKHIVHPAPAATEKQAIQAVESAEAAFDTWRDSTPLARRTILNKAVEILESRKDELVNAMVSETGAKPSWAAFNIKTGIQFVMEGAGMATQVKGELLQSNDKGSLPLAHVMKHTDFSGALAMVFKEPCGVVLGIAPWNAPIVSDLAPLSHYTNLPYRFSESERSSLH
jgi:acyl-CoA reductase-like NAD-dependent aldehyde dehydrogenase